jgi:hypothetical protein
MCARTNGSNGVDIRREFAGGEIAGVQCKGKRRWQLVKLTITERRCGREGARSGIHISEVTGCKDEFRCFNVSAGHLRRFWHVWRMSGEGAKSEVTGDGSGVPA